MEKQVENNNFSESNNKEVKDEYTIAKEKVNGLIKELKLEEAKLFMEEIIEKYSDKAEMFDIFSEILFSLGFTKEAKRCIEKSITLDPFSSGDKYMTLGQIYDSPKKKKECFEKGIEIYRKKLEEAKNNKQTVNPLIDFEENSETNLKQAISSALSSVAELYMTTYLCDEKNAEEICEQLLKEAFFIDKDNPDVLVQYSNLRILRKKDKEAEDYLYKAFEVIKTNKNECFPDTDLLVNIAKNFAELGNFYHAVKVLDIAVEMDDSNSENWYLLAFNHFQLKNYIHCVSCIEKVKESMKNSGEVDKELTDATTELENELKIIESKGELKNSVIEEMNEGKEECISNGNSMVIEED